MSEDRDIGPYIYVGGLFSCVLLLLTIVIYLFTRYKELSVLYMYMYIGGILAAQFIYSKLWNVFVSICSRIICRSPRPRWSGVFLLNACVALLLLNLSVVASYHGRSSEKGCHSFSAILHYVFLASVLSLTALAVPKFGRARGMKNKERTCGEKTFVIISGLAIIWSK